MSKITPTELSALLGTVTLVDVRKPKARQASGRQIEGSVFRHPFDAANWAPAVAGHQLVIYCVHGHEVSQSVCGFLRDEGIHCRYVEGGMTAMIEAGINTVAIDVTGANHAQSQ
ncbi:MAG: rhodanese-like domain-containing protein [Pseudomonadota bacterium]